MRLFAGKPQNSLKGSDWLANRIASSILQCQKMLAGKLNNRTAHLSQRQKKVFLLSFCIVLGGLNLYLILQAIF